MKSKPTVDEIKAVVASCSKVCHVIIQQQQRAAIQHLVNGDADSNFISLQMVVVSHRLVIVLAFCCLVQCMQLLMTFPS